MVGRSVRDFENKFRADYGSDAEEKIGRYTYVEVGWLLRIFFVCVCVCVCVSVCVRALVRALRCVIFTCVCSHIHTACEHLSPILPHPHPQTHTHTHTHTTHQVLEARPVSNVSRTHCRLAYDRRREEFYVVDFGSANGTRVHDPDPPLPWSYDVEGGVIGSADLFKRHREAKRYKCWLAPGKVRRSVG